MVNDTSYNFDELLPYFKKSTSFTPPDMSKRFANSTAKYTTDSYGTGGPVDVSFANYATPLSTWLSKGFAGVGMPEADDFNSGTLNGYQWCASTIRNSDATRSSSQAFVDSARGNRNLKVYINTMARKVLFDENKTAIGVEVESTGITYKIHASKEVILSAGTFQSPQMLMVSGVGPKATLEEYNIEVLADRPGVGQNMWDHIFFGPAMEVNFNTLTRIAHDPIYLAEQAFDYLFKHDGVLSSSVDWLGWEKLPDAYRANLSSSAKSDLDSFPSDWPEVEVRSTMSPPCLSSSSHIIIRFKPLTIRLAVLRGQRVPGRLRQPSGGPAIRWQAVRNDRGGPGSTVVPGQRDDHVRVDDGQARHQPELADARDGRGGGAGAVAADARGVGLRGDGAGGDRARVLAGRGRAVGRGRARGDPQLAHDGVARGVHVQDGHCRRRHGRCRQPGPRLWRPRSPRSRCQCVCPPAARPPAELRL